jgi:hypothetical protein
MSLNLDLTDKLNYTKLILSLLPKNNKTQNQLNGCD